MYPFFLIILTTIAADDVCEKWFIEAGLKANQKGCVQKCSSTMVDMGTFTCPDECEDLCKSTVLDKVLEPFSYVKGLTEGDRAEIAKYPKDALIVYEAKIKVDSLTEKVFGKAGKNDESDAFRHFVWAGLLVKELGKERAETFLAAHEQDPDQPKKEKEMDLINNKLGVDFSSKELKEGRTIDISILEKKALESLKQGKLNILTPTKKTIPDGYYSK